MWYMEKKSRKTTTAPSYRRTDGSGADIVHHVPWIAYQERGPPPTSRSSHPGEFSSIDGNFAGETQRREIHTFLNNSMQKGDVMRKHGSGFFLKAITLLGIAALGLSACGGGGGSSSSAPPSSPATLTAGAGDNQVALNWPLVSAAATYNVYYGTATPVTKSSTKITGSVSAPKTVTGLANGTPYFFAVSAVNAGGESALSVERSATPSATPPPDIPSNIRAAAGDNQVTVSWDSVAGATSYNVYFGTSAGVTKASVDNIIGAASPQVKTGLLNGTPYFFVVTALNGNGESAVSFEVSATPTATPPPAAPSLTSATAGNTQVTLVWDPVTGATSYNVYRGTAAGVTKATGTKVAGVTSPYVATGLTNGTVYFFIVTAQSANGEGAASNELSATPTVPTAAFSQADLTGTWKINMLRTSADNTSNGWLRATGAADASGNLTILSFEDSTGATTLPPGGGLQWTIDGSGVVSEIGVNGDDNVHMTMTSNKNFMAGTAGSINDHALRVVQKVEPGTVYSNADLASKSFVLHDLMVGADNMWFRSDGTTDATGMASLANDIGPGIGIGPGVDRGAQPNVGRFSVDGGGTVTIDTIPLFKGFLSADKKTIVGTSTETNAGNTYYHLMIFQISGQTYSASDLVGTSSHHLLGVGNANFWLHYTTTGAVGGVVTFSDWLVSNGNTTANAPVNVSITSSGTVTVAENPSYHGTMSFDKKFTVATQTTFSGAYSLQVATH
jgi:fibronectin type 3 domain-containing protein